MSCLGLIFSKTTYLPCFCLRVCFHDFHRFPGHGGLQLERVRLVRAHEMEGVGRQRLQEQDRVELAPRRQTARPRGPSHRGQDLPYHDGVLCREIPKAIILTSSLDSRASLLDAWELVIAIKMRR